MSQYDVIVVGAGNAALAAAVSARENGAECVVVLEKAPREMRGGNTHWSGGVLRFAFDDPREIGPLLPGVEDEIEDFYDGIQPYTFDDFHGDLMRVTSGQTDPVLSRILVQNSRDTVFWMNRVGNIRMEPATSLTGVRKGNKIIWARGLVVRAAHEGVGLSRSWFATAEKMGIEIRYGAAVTAILQDDRGHASACVTMAASRTSTAEPLSSAAAASRPTCRCAPSTSVRWSAAPRCAAPRTIRATACAWPWPSAPCPGANGAAATPPPSPPTGATSPRANSPTEATGSATSTAS